MLSLPEHLLLIALHDDKGTVHPAAWLALDTGLRGALLAELRLRGMCATSGADQIRRDDVRWRRTGIPVVDDAVHVLGGVDSPAPVAAWMTAIEKGVTGVRDRVADVLQRRGVLEEADVERVGLPSGIVYPMRDDTEEQQMRERLAASLSQDGPDMSPRLGTLIALVDACNLLGAAFSKQDRALAAERAAWVRGRDAIARVVYAEVRLLEGTST